jgi:hypothetical protein
MTTPDIELAGRLTDLASDAWALRARVADLRGLQIGFQVCPEAYDAMVDIAGDPVKREAVAEFLTFSGTATEGHAFTLHRAPILVGIRARNDPALSRGPDGRWTLALVLAPDHTPDAD